MNKDPKQIAERLAKQWPKKCGCGAVYIGPHAWALLPFGYERQDAFSKQEARHCRCGSTLVIDVQIFDLDEE